MRIIAGALRGRRLLSIKDPGLRPISGRIKQSLFDILKPRVAGARFLDLFAGTGAVGLEALSRGAAFVFFVDSNIRCRDLIERNLERAELASRGKVHPGSALGDLSWIPFRSGVAQYDLIFMGPPYKTAEKRPLAYTNPVLKGLSEAGLLAPEGLVISQHHVKEAVEAPAGWELFRREKYGDTFLSFLRARSAEQTTS